MKTAGSGIGPTRSGATVQFWGVRAPARTVTLPVPFAAQHSPPCVLLTRSSRAPTPGDRGGEVEDDPRCHACRSFVARRFLDADDAAFGVVGDHFGWQPRQCHVDEVRVVAQRHLDAVAGGGEVLEPRDAVNNDAREGRVLVAGAGDGVAEAERPVGEGWVEASARCRSVLI